MTQNDDLNDLFERADKLTGLSAARDSVEGAIGRQTIVLVDTGIAIAKRLDRIARALERQHDQAISAQMVDRLRDGS